MKSDVQPAIVEMTCMEVRALSVDYFEGDLGLGAYIRIDAHLKKCGHCSAVYVGMRNVVELLASDELFDVLNGLEESIYNKVIGSWGSCSNQG